MTNFQGWPNRYFGEYFGNTDRGQSLGAGCAPERARVGLDGDLWCVWAEIEAGSRLFYFARASVVVVEQRNDQADWSRPRTHVSGARVHRVTGRAAETETDPRRIRRPAPDRGILPRHELRRCFPTRGCAARCRDCVLDLHRSRRGCVPVVATRSCTGSLNQCFCFQI